MHVCVCVCVHSRLAKGVKNDAVEFRAPEKPERQSWEADRDADDLLERVWKKKCPHCRYCSTGNLLRAWGVVVRHCCGFQAYGWVRLLIGFLPWHLAQASPATVRARPQGRGLRVSTSMTPLSCH